MNWQLDNNDDNKYHKIKNDRNRRHHRRGTVIVLGAAAVVCTVGYLCHTLLAQRGEDDSTMRRDGATTFVARQRPLPHSAVSERHARSPSLHHHTGTKRHVVAEEYRKPPDLPPRKTRIKDLIEQFSKLDSAVRNIKSTGVLMETDPQSLEATGKLQSATRRLLLARYGPDDVKQYRVELILEFQQAMPDFETNGPHGKLVLEMAPSALVPYSVFSFLEIARKYQGGAFHRAASHVLQVKVDGEFPSLAFQEYHKDYPHVERTVGYAGRPSGPEWYVSTIDNTYNHGPGSQQDANPNEADSCFGRVVEGYETVVPRIKLMGNEFIEDEKRHVLIREMNILVADGGIADASDGYIVWKAPPDAER